jgi:hypothetical protein
VTTATVRLPALDWAAPIIEPATGRPSPYFQRFWQNITVKVTLGEGASIDVSGKADKGTSSGWTAATGATSKATFATWGAPAVSNPPTQAEVQALSNHVQVLSQHLKALIDAGLTSGLLSV